MGLMDRFKTHLDPAPEDNSGSPVQASAPSAESQMVPASPPALTDDGAQLWITARFDGQNLSISVAGAEEYLGDDPSHRTRTAGATFDLMDEPGLRSARAVLVPLVRGMSESQRARLEPRRLAAIPAPELEAVEAVRDALEVVLDAYRAPLSRVVRRMARQAEDAAYSHDLESAA